MALTYNHMVVDMKSQTSTDEVFHALADATRRSILTHTLGSEYSVSSLARLYPMSFAAVQKHVAVLERAHLVSKRRRGREQLVMGDVNEIRKAYKLLEEIEEVWRNRIERMEKILAQDPEEGAEQ